MSLSPQAFTELWIEDIVVGLNLCPFAKKVIRDQQIKFVTTSLTERSELISLVNNELQVLDNLQCRYQTTIIIATELSCFKRYWQELEAIDQFIDRTPYRGLFQIASFHPAYQFVGTEREDQTNYSNQSPFPLFHIIRESSITDAKSWYPDLDSIPSRNQQLLSTMPKDKAKALFSKYLSFQN